MGSNAGKSSCMRNLVVRVLLCAVLVLAVRFAYVITLAGESCALGDFCFFSLSKNGNLVVAGAGAAAAATGSVSPTPDPRRSKDWIRSVKFYSSLFQDLMAEEFLSPGSKSICIEPDERDMQALKEVGVRDATGVPAKSLRSLSNRKSESYDFIFSGGGRFDSLQRASEFAVEMQRVLKPRGIIVAHIRANDTYSFNSFLQLFNHCRLLRMFDVDASDPSMLRLREIVLKKESDFHVRTDLGTKPKTKIVDKCIVAEYKQKLVRQAEPLIKIEPLKPWIELKANLKNIKYLSSMADISFKTRYIYIDIGARSYGSSIVSWFKKQYPKQNKTFEIYAIEADKHFYNDYKTKKGVTLLPYAAWVRNESLYFEINRDTDQKIQDKGRGMGRIQPGQSSSSDEVRHGDVEKIQGFDFAEWLKNTVTERDFVVVKMDVEGTEFDLIPRLFKTGAICLIDEMFLECHYNRWQRCCPGQRSAKYQKTYGQCLDLFSNLRQRGVLVHQWW